jgi:hypothetical protein
MSFRIPQLGRSPQANGLQRTRLLAIVDENPILITKQFSSEFTYKGYQAMWNEIAAQLNQLGPEKDVKGWQKVQ